MGKIYTALKGFVVVSTTGCSIAIFTGLSGTMASYVLGSLVGIAAIFLAFDTFGMAQALNKLNKENDRFHQSNDDLRKENLRLSSGINDLKNTVNEFQKQNDILQTQVVGLASTSTDLQKQVVDLTSLKDQQQRQIDSLRLVQNQSKQLIQALMTAGDDFKEFQSCLVENMDRIEHTSDAMALLLDKLGMSQFQSIDADHDGNITQQELTIWSLDAANKKKIPD